MSHIYKFIDKITYQEDRYKYDKRTIPGFFIDQSAPFKHIEPEGQVKKQAKSAIPENNFQESVVRLAPAVRPEFRRSGLAKAKHHFFSQEMLQVNVHGPEPSLISIGGHPVSV